MLLSNSLVHEKGIDVTLLRMSCVTTMMLGGGMWYSIDVWEVLTYIGLGWLSLWLHLLPHICLRGDLDAECFSGLCEVATASSRKLFLFVVGLTYIDHAIRARLQICVMLML